jgi:uncharacterized protein YkwD
MPPSDITQNVLRRLRTLLLASSAVCSLALGAMPAQAAERAHCAGASAVPGNAGTQALAHSTLCLINAERAHRGLQRLHLNTRLSQAATRHSSDMVRQHYFAHTSPAGRTMVDRVRVTGYLRAARSWTLGENIEWGTIGLSSPAAALKAWMHSPGHKANILHASFRQIGIGVVFGGPRVLGRPAATYTTDFGVTG